MSFADCALPPLGPGGHTAAEAQALFRALHAVWCCGELAGILLCPLRDPAVCEPLGSAAAYRLAAALSWECSADTAAALRAGLQWAQGNSGTPTFAWRELPDAAAAALWTGRKMMEVGVPMLSGGSPTQHSAAVLATLCKQDRLLALLEAALDVLAAADEAVGAARGPGPARIDCALTLGVPICPGMLHTLLSFPEAWRAPPTARRLCEGG